MPPDSQAHPPRFRLWLRRQNVAEGPFALRFEVMEGKGILRVARPGVLIDSPARPVGLEERLTTQQLRSTRFILVWDGGRARQGHLLNRLDEAQLDRVELDRWHEMEIVVDGGFRYAVLQLAPAAVEAKPQKAKSRRPSLSELRQALDSITVHREEVEDVDSALASLTGPVPPPRPPAPASPAPRSLAEAAQVPLPAPGARPPAPEAPRPPLAPAPPRPREPLVASGHEVSLRRSRPLDLENSRTVSAGEDDEGHEDMLALGEADGEADDAEALSLGEADESMDESAETLMLGGDEPMREALLDPPSTSSVPAPALALGAAAFYASFTDDAEEAVFSVDLPSHRVSTEHVTIRKGEDDDAVVFAREELPPIRGLAAPKRARAARPPDDAILELPGDLPAVAPPPDIPAPPKLPERPPRASPTDAWKGATTIAPEQDGDSGVVHRSSTTLVRHMRRRVEEQRARIVELELRVLELETALAARPLRG
ncbi:hypothetical protein LBMAG42_29160 [Deltaproteobacteria bacterium]|nr:hypothetical protein LBMAG42_29160 [Deltaproteobacteria bacterium]